jgi:HEAT repeat protein/energy-coupling factor transporter ATP-binding protein EcfA2
MSGSGGGGGYEYQARAAAYVAAHILAQEPLVWIEHESPDVPIAVAQETGGAGDDLCITLHDGVQIELQAKHGLQKDKLWEPLIKLVQGLQENPQLYGVLLTDTTASKIIREDLRKDLIRLGQGRTDGLKSITQEAQQRFAEANLPDSDKGFFRRLRIVVLDLDDGLQDGKYAQPLLSKVLHDSTQSVNVWKILWGEGLKLISNAGYRDSKDWARLLNQQGIQLASKCAQTNGVMSPEERNYLESVRNKFEVWWKPQAFMDEIDESTWFEFGLNTKVPRPKDENNPSQNNNPDKEITIPILDALSQSSNERILIVGKPGAGKSTLLKQILLRSSKKALEDFNAPIPVLIELNCYTQQPNILDLIGAAFEKYNFLSVISEQEKIIHIKSLIKDKRLLLLVDGVNGLSREARSALKDFCDRDLPIILTTREVDAGNLGIQKKLEIQPLKPEKVKEFFNKNLPNHQGRVKELCDRVSDFGQTPLMVWMLYSIFRQNPQSEIPTTRGEAYRRFTTIYVERGKEDIDLGEWKSQLSQLAFEMTRSETPIFESYVHNLLGSTQTLEHLLNNHLLQWDDGIPGSRKVVFCHPSLQEYFTAEYLLPNLTELIKEIPDQDHTEFQITYLNHLKWTEAITLMISLPEATDDQAIKIVSQALKIDLFLGARLAGEGRCKFHLKTIQPIKNLEIPDWFKLNLLGETKSYEAIETLNQALIKQDISQSWHAIFALKNIGTPEKIFKPLMEALKNPDAAVHGLATMMLREIVNEQFSDDLLSMLCESPDSTLRLRVINVLVQIPSDRLFNALQEIFHNPDEEFELRKRAAGALWQVGDEQAVQPLQHLLQDSDLDIRASVVATLANIKHESVVEPLMAVLINRSENHNLRRTAAETLAEMGIPQAVELMQKILLDSTDNLELRQALPRQLEQYGNDKVVQSLLQVSGNLQEELWLRISSVDALGTIRNQQPVKILQRIILDQDGDSNLRSRSVISLARINKDETFEFLLNIIEDENENLEFREQIIDAFGWMSNDYRVVKKLQEILLDYSVPSELRRRAAYTLRYSNSQETEEILIDVLKDESSIVVSSAVHSLKILRSHAACSAFVELLKHDDFNVRKDVAYALGSIGSKEAVSELINLLEDKNLAVCEAAIFALTQIGGGEVASALLQVLPKLQDCSMLYRPVVHSLEQGEGSVVTEPLLQAFMAADSGYKHIAGEVLGKVASPTILPRLVSLISEAESDALAIISAIQSRCGFYNYDIPQSTPKEIPIEIQQGGNQYIFPNATKVQIIEHIDDYNENYNL